MISSSSMLDEIFVPIQFLLDEIDDSDMLTHLSTC